MVIKPHQNPGCLPIDIYSHNDGYDGILRLDVGELKAIKFASHWE
jgi:hypothetical protein